ncbi:hypothetical protein Agub_g11437 [Astrephomene gubernaculifera]|uniref:AAA+ ATPase domain-containing protein n=1 Tax=Astrephomene gubernaculifera TaxID=47775 RepID=A0AAD3HQN6_9CHLO|nr:hypothetical protein Agub_g11437 [Astrephomene gubernaculifera]
MDDPQLQRAIYASIQTARSQGYSLGGNKGGGQAFRSSAPAFTRGTGSSSNNAAITRSSYHPSVGSARVGNRTQQPHPHSHQPHPHHPRTYSSSSLPGVGAASGPLSGSDASAGHASLRSSYGHVDALRRDGIVPASTSGAGVVHTGGPSSSALSAVTPGGGSAAAAAAGSQASQQRGSTPSRGHLVSVPPRGAAPSPTRLRNQHQQRQLQHPHQRNIPPHKQQHQQSLPERSRAAPRYPSANPVLEAIAAVTAEAHSAFENAATTRVTAAMLTTAAPPSTGAGALRSPGATTNTAASAASCCTAPPCMASTSPSTAAPGGGMFVMGSPHAASPAVGGNAPPPRALLPVAMSDGRVMMVPEGIDPALAQTVLRDAVTWDTGVTFDDIAGCDRAKQLLHEAVALPLIIPEFFTGIREPWRGVLLHGPPGTGKTLLAKAVAGMVGGAFFAVSPSSLTSKWRGESEKLLAALFAVAQAHAPAIIFIDEVDALGGSRGGEGEHEASRRFKAELLQQMDGLASGRGVMVLAATNCPWDLDPALRRRLEKRIHIGLPDAPQRESLLRLHLRGVTLARDVDLAVLAAACEGLSGADIRLLCRDAAMAPLRRQIGGLATPSCSSSSSSLPQLPAPSTTQQQQLHQEQQQQQLSQQQQQSPQGQQQQQQQQQQSMVILRSAADIRRLADSGELARTAVVSAMDLEVARGSLRPSVSSEQAARYEQWDREFASV